MPLPGLPNSGSAPADEKVFELRKGARRAVCWRRLHPLGIELRIDVNGDTMRTTVEKTVEGARTAADGMRDAMLGMGWSDTAT